MYPIFSGCVEDHYVHCISEEKDLPSDNITLGAGMELDEQEELKRTAAQVYYTFHVQSFLAQISQAAQNLGSAIDGFQKGDFLPFSFERST